MPNDCWNRITIKATEDHIRTILTTEFKDVPPHCFKLIENTAEILTFRMWSPNRPNKEFMNRLYENYDDIWIKNQWTEEGGNAGVIVGKKADLQELVWNEGCIEEWAHRLRPMNNKPTPVLNENNTHNSINPTALIRGL